MSVVGTGTLAGTAQVDAAVAAAARALPVWARTPHHERAAVLMRAAAPIEQSAEAWGYELAAEEGQTFAEDVDEALRAAQVLRLCSGEADRRRERYVWAHRGERVLVTRRPLDVNAVIQSFNIRIAVPVRKLASGCPMAALLVYSCR